MTNENQKSEKHNFNGQIRYVHPSELDEETQQQLEQQITALFRSAPGIHTRNVGSIFFLDDGRAFGPYGREEFPYEWCCTHPLYRQWEDDLKKWYRPIFVRLNEGQSFHRFFGREFYNLKMTGRFEEFALPVLEWADEVGDCESYPEALVRIPPTSSIFTPVKGTQLDPTHALVLLSTSQGTNSTIYHFAAVSIQLFGAFDIKDWIEALKKVFETLKKK